MVMMSHTKNIYGGTFMIDHKTAVKIIKQVIWNERGRTSGYVHDPDDPGGETFCGISRNNHPFWKGWTIIDALKEYDGFEKVLRGHDRLNQMVYEFYYEHYYEGKIQGIGNERIRFLAMDFKVHSGSNGIKCLQTALNRYYKWSRLKIDGVIGNKTYEALFDINRKQVDQFIHILLGVRSGFFINCRKSWKYLDGWMERQNQNEIFVMKWENE